VKIAPNNLDLISGWEEIVFATPRVEQVICNRWKINTGYEKVLS
jgi:hypothetical protein